MGRNENVEIFQDTAKLCKNNPELKENHKKAVNGQKLMLEIDALPVVNKNIYQEPAKIVVSKKRTFEAASVYQGNTICVHNFASASNPGGGVTKGSNAQEECLCRCSDLYLCLNTPQMWDGFYTPHRAAKDPLHNDDIIYTPGVTVFKTDTVYPKLMPKNDWFNVNVITCAAPNLREKPSNSYNSGDGRSAVKISNRDLLALHEKRLSRILDVAVMQGNEVVILGAFGCGVFLNNPEIVARAAKNVITEYLQAFQVIEFAIYCSPRDERNYEIFKRVLTK